MKASIVIIGDEILLGQVVDTNSGNIAKLLSPLGWEVVDIQVVGDSAAAIRQAVERALECADLVITTGGLGPTKDDITKKVLAQYFGDGELVLDPAVLANVETVFAKRGLVLNDLTRAQALVPTCCQVIQNVLGTAPIMWFEAGGKVLVSMPGVPFECIGMMKNAVLGRLSGHFTPDTIYLHHTLMVTGITESDLAEKLDAYELSLPAGMHLAYLPEPGIIRLRLDCQAKGDAKPIEDEFNARLQQLKAELGDKLLYDGDATPAKILLEMLEERRYTVATAESCTGGNIAHLITSIPGSSKCYMGGVVSYSNKVKTNVLEVSAANLKEYGAVSASVASQMADGAAKACLAHCSMSTTGIAGPDGGTDEKPVGTVWIGAHVPKATITQKFVFPGDRDRVIARASTQAILMLIQLLKDTQKTRK